MYSIRSRSYLGRRGTCSLALGYCIVSAEGTRKHTAYNYTHNNIYKQIGNAQCTKITVVYIKILESLSMKKKMSAQVYTVCLLAQFVPCNFPFECSMLLSCSSVARHTLSY